MRIELLAVEYAWFLLVIPVFIAVHLFMLNYSKGKALKFANLEAISRISKGRAGMGFGGAVNKDVFVLVRRVFILLVFVLAVAQPVLFYEGRTSGFDYVVALDNSLSMSADDFSPNRLEAAKGASSEFFSLVSGGSDVGLVSFASTALVIAEVGDNIDVGTVELNKAGGTAIGDAVITSSNMLEGHNREKAIILMTDGQNNAGSSVEEAINYANAKNIVVHTVGIGSDEGGLLDIGIISTLNEEDLKALSSETGGEYFRAGSKDELDNVLTGLVSFDIAELDIFLGSWLLLAGFLLLLVEWLFFGTFYKVVKG
tara:strand:- start:8015 stop:8953 length:939 start_codon:yes stop_codon:yes gene_type:complete